ncbi:uncharacterized protein LOC144711437 [Wolffia australiana]
MGKKLLYEVLREEQEPFALQSFLQERRRPPALPLNRSASLAQLRSGSVKRRPLLSCLALLRNPFSSSTSSAAPIALRALSRSGREEDPRPFLQQPRGKKRKKRKRKSGEEGDDGDRSPPNGRARWGVVDFLAKKLFSRKRDAGREPRPAGGEPAISLPSPDGGTAAVRSSTLQDEADPGSPASPGAPAAEPGRSPQLFCGDGATPLALQDKEQSSPVSVLDPPFYEEEDGRRRGKCSAAAEGDDPDDEDADNGDVEGRFRLRLASLERTREELLLRISRFEGIAADLDPVGTRCALELDDGANSASAVRRRLEFWNPAESEFARRAVETDLRRGWAAWRWRADQAPELAAELSRALFTRLVDDLALELCSR